MEVLDLQVGMQNEDFQIQNEQQQNSPKIKKIRKLVRKSKKQTSSEEDNNIFQEDEVDIKKNNANSDLNDIDNNMFENKLLIQEDNNDKQTTYKSKLDELSEQIALMDAEKQQKKSRKLNKKKNFSEDNEYQYFDDDEEKKIAEKQEKKKQKKQKEKIELEKNEDMIKRLADKFNDEEEDIDDNYQNQKDNDDDEDYEDGTDQNQRKKKRTKGAASKSSQNAAIIKTNNKLFKEINTLESANLDNIEEQPVEEECLLEESIKFERQNNKNQKNLLDFLKQSMIYKKQRGIDYENSQNMLRESTNILERSQSFNASKQISVNQEQYKEQLEQSQNMQNLSQRSQNNQQEMQLKSGVSVIANSDDSQKLFDFPNTQTEIPIIDSIAPKSSQDKKLQLLKQSSQKITRMLSFSQSQNLSQGLNKQSQSQDDDLELELQVPTIDQSQKHQQLINNTLFFNKIIRTNNQNLLLKQQSSISSTNSNTQIAGQAGSQKMLEKIKPLSRGEFLKQSQKRFTERKSQNIDLKAVQNTFKQTTFDHLLEQNDKKQKKNQSSEEKEDGEKSRTETKKNEDDENDSQNTENDSDYDPNKNSEESEAEEANNDEKSDDKEGDKQRQLLEAEIQYRKLLALEEGIDEKDFERQIRLEYGLETEQQENLEIDDDLDQESEDLEENPAEKDNKQDEENQDQQAQNLEDQLVGFEEDAEGLNQNKLNDDNESEIKPMRRLKNIAAEILKKQQEKKEKERIRQQKEERRKQLLNNPIMKKIMNEMIDDEAELGSDNEENDDKIKQIGDEDEYKEAGLSKDEDLDAELKELINNIVEFNEENEQLATSKFIRDLEKRDKEEIKKIIEGAYKGTRAKRRNLSDLLVEDGETSESKKLKRIQDAIRTLQEQTGENQYSDEEDENESEEDFDPITGNQKTNKSKSKKDHNEKEQIQIREANLLLKKEYQKASEQNKFDEKNLVDSSILDLIQNKQAGNTQTAQGPAANGTTIQKKIIPTKISEKVGVLKGNLSFGNGQTSLAQQLVSQKQQQNQQNIQGFSNLRGANLKNSILHVKNNKNRFSQFNDSFNKESMINEFGESALTKAFQNYADHSQSIFYSKQNNEDSNSRPLDKGNKLNKKSSSNQSAVGQGSSSQNFKNVSSINKLFKSNSTSLAQTPSNSFAQQFGKKKFSTTSNDSKK
ncbi:hypothetical protein TTHERM_00058860 (macronuclear) [Tetrahymena thermophila SB210]|uniref:Uncharacterized protein n=1 Tax=Tetrahymena thermophila (strain SB210) TaxID=312017 RepID=I7MDD4_TETTS|nr:hypothetical protein TTHERM_00058860 [Tetrahymena thermophila SB210]EAR87374.3 hypothetical protein TTHERM_00058860 [Tetrahymena thermophila SB210]|eukprot:XP_001007619.3 hypothetical protein TTHERM_00058860 [Tetrahymena thermophila SB210]